MRLNHFSALVYSLGFFFPVATLAAYTSTTLTASNAYLITGHQAQLRLGNSMTTVGDVDGDGYDDVVASAYIDGSTQDLAYLIYGGATTSGTTTTSALPSFRGSEGGGYAGSIVSAAGDIDGDGYADFLVGNTFESSSAGKVAVVYGSATRYTGVTSFNTLPVFTGEAAGSYLGSAMAAGDLNQDGYDDLVIAAYGYSSFTGRVYVVYGRPTRFVAGSQAITAVAASVFTGAVASGRAGSDVSVVGDTTGDGYPDLVITAANQDSYRGFVYWFDGESTNFAPSTTLNTTTQVNWSGEETYDNFGVNIAGAGDVDGDGLGDILVGSADQAIGDTIQDGSYLIYGQSNFTIGTTAASTLPKFITEVAADDVYHTVAAGNIDGDQYADLIFGYDHLNTATGGIYVQLGSAIRFTGTNSLTNAHYRFVPGAAATSFGFPVATHSDPYTSIFISAVADSTGGSGAGALYQIFPYIDADNDGVAGTAGLISGTDCSDSDGTVSENQTYYLDGDGDGLGVGTSTTSVCSSTAPAGYVSNADDTNDGVINNGVEINGDGLDNDGDSIIDEVNTLSENGAHPGYSTGDISSDDAYDAAVTDIIGTTNGDVLVTYADNSVYQYDVFAITSNKTTLVHVHPDAGLVVVVHPKARSMVLLNSLSGEEHGQKTLNTKSHQKVKTVLKDMRDDGTYELVVAAKRNPITIHVNVVTVKVNSLVLQKRISITRKYKQAVMSKTKVKRTSITLRNQRGKTVERFTVKKNYTLVD